MRKESGEMMSDSTMARLLEYLRTVKGWSDSEIVDLLEYISGARTAAEHEPKKDTK